MPWEKNFDQEEAIERIMEVFWQKGYEATSLTDLTEESSGRVSTTLLAANEICLFVH